MHLRFLVIVKKCNTSRVKIKCHILANVLHIWMIPHIHTLFEFISIPYEYQHQILYIKKIDRGQIKFREYSITLLQPYVYNYLKPQKRPKRVNMHTSKSHQSKHISWGIILDHLNAFSLSGNIFSLSQTTKGEFLSSPYSSSIGRASGYEFHGCWFESNHGQEIFIVYF